MVGRGVADGDDGRRAAAFQVTFSVGGAEQQGEFVGRQAHGLHDNVVEMPRLGVGEGPSQRRIVRLAWGIQTVFSPTTLASFSNTSTGRPFRSNQCVCLPVAPGAFLRPLSRLGTGSGRVVTRRARRTSATPGTPNRPPAPRLALGCQTAGPQCTTRREGCHPVPQTTPGAACPCPGLG